MEKSIEEIVGKIERVELTPGTRAGESDKVRYVSYTNQEFPGDMFGDISSVIRAMLPNFGGASLPNWTVEVPDGTMFFPFEFHGDVPAWQKQFEQGAKSLQRLSAKVDNRTFVISDGRSIPLNECKSTRSINHKREVK